MLAREFNLCFYVQHQQLGEGVGNFDPVSTSASITSLASVCGWLEDVVLESVPVEEAEGGYAICFADFPVLWTSTV